jgi:hypothetical protein
MQRLRGGRRRLGRSARGPAVEIGYERSISSRRTSIDREDPRSFRPRGGGISAATAAGAATRQARSARGSDRHAGTQPQTSWQIAPGADTRGAGSDPRRGLARVRTERAARRPVVPAQRLDAHDRALGALARGGIGDVADPERRAEVVRRERVAGGTDDQEAGNGGAAGTQIVQVGLPKIVFVTSQVAPLATRKAPTPAAVGVRAARTRTPR